MAPTYQEENLASPSIAFPLRLRQGLLQKTNEREAYLMLLEIMARTPRGSWPGHSSFGFQEFFSKITKEGLPQESRIRIAEVAAKEINGVLADLGLTRYRVESLVLDPLEKDLLGGESARWAGHAMERRGVTLMLRENGGGHAAGFAL